MLLLDADATDVLVLDPDADDWLVLVTEEPGGVTVRGRVTIDGSPGTVVLAGSPGRIVIDRPSTVELR